MPRHSQIILTKTLALAQRQRKATKNYDNHALIANNLCMLALINTSNASNATV